MVPTPAEAAVVSGEGGEQREVSCSASSSACSNISIRLSSISGWDVEADATLLELLGEDSRILSEVSGLLFRIVSVSHESRRVAEVSVYRHAHRVFVLLFKSERQSRSPKPGGQMLSADCDLLVQQVDVNYIIRLFV